MNPIPLHLVASTGNLIEPTFIEYVRIKKGNHILKETTDFVAQEEKAENKIIPDAAFIIENIETKNALCFLLKWIWQQRESYRILQETAE